jgi:hypothetical protein
MPAPVQPAPLVKSSRAEWDLGAPTPLEPRQRTTPSSPYVWLLAIFLLLAAIPVGIYALDYYGEIQDCREWEATNPVGNFGKPNVRC